MATTTAVFRLTQMTDGSSCRCPINSNIDYENDTDDKDDCESCCSESCSSCSTATAGEHDEGLPSPEAAGRLRLVYSETITAAAATTPELLDAHHLSSLLDTEKLMVALDECLSTEYVRGCVVETWDAVLSDQLEAIAHYVLYQSPDHVVGQAVYEQLSELSAALRPPPTAQQSLQQNERQQQQQSTRVDAERVYGTLRSAARSMLTTRVDVCCRQSMFRAVGSAVVTLRSNTRPVFSVENFLVDINDAANFANLYCAEYARRICVALKDIYNTVMAGDYHPTNVIVQMTVMEKSIRAALQTLADARATGPQKTVAQRSLLTELDEICTTLRMKNYGCVDVIVAGTGHQEPRTVARATDRPTTIGRSVYFTISPWRAPIRMYHQQSPGSIDQLLKSTVRLVEMLFSELFKPCLTIRNDSDGDATIITRSTTRSSKFAAKQI